MMLPLKPAEPPIVPVTALLDITALELRIKPVYFASIINVSINEGKFTTDCTIPLESLMAVKTGDVVVGSPAYMSTGTPAIGSLLFDARFMFKLTALVVAKSKFPGAITLSTAMGGIETCEFTLAGSFLQDNKQEINQIITNVMISSIWSRWDLWVFNVSMFFVFKHDAMDMPFFNLL
ncbi:hypothetical protein [Mucilaginibacter flavus]|uniref:hypothetical protein n=1 Tax=Mucilaginibacter flavus TaxID=931504 RepID=UPI0025B3CED2|nr:hypothetical protein [Mucilaginibacter flavus]MDN3582061.1 hypothetical protein [Mucilaginibacter flavus]